MLEIIPTDKPHLVVVRASGTVTREDYQSVLIPQLHAQTGKINVVYILDTAVSDYTAGAMWTDTVTGLRYLFSWHKIAFVCADSELKTAFDFFSRLLPGELRSFGRNDLDAAIEWAGS